MTLATTDIFEFSPELLEPTGTRIGLDPGPTETMAHDFRNVHPDDARQIAGAAIWHTDTLTHDQLNGLGVLLGHMGMRNREDKFFGAPPTFDEADLVALGAMFDVARKTRYGY